MHGEKFADIRTDGEVEGIDPAARFVSVQRAQALLGDVTYRQIGLMIQRRELRSCKLGRRRLVELASINEVLDAAMAAAMAAASAENGKDAA
ncbi:hypothetical protein [Micromonospora sp. HM134]|uniref:hypothetical protein n=1 Tax=Micromonospora sp. HM134 TaxID=2583243 RepID=UPI001F10EB1D|nr:hypothetical protein [Micromonospora sp. HM134]